jgi:hypothetical protein
VPNPKSTSEIGESYENTGMAGLAARTAKSKYFLYRVIMMEGEGEEEMAREKRKGGGWGLANLEVLPRDRTPMELGWEPETGLVRSSDFGMFF